jgi:hypothetical protein
MASPLFDALHLKLGRLVDDPVAAAATNGGELTSALRTEYLNRANKYIQSVIWPMGRAVVEKYLRGLIAVSGTATVSGARALPTDYSYWLAFYEYGTYTQGVWVDPSQLTQGTANNPNPDIVVYFTIYGGNLYAYNETSTVADAAHAFWYVKNDQRASSGDTADISIDSIWYDTLVDLAASYHFSEKGSADKAAFFLGRANATIAQIVK